MYQIDQLLILEKAYEQNVRQHFVEFFQAYKSVKPTPQIVAHDLTSLARFHDVDSVYSGSGMSVILTDYDAGENPCSFERDGLRAIYRGHCRTIKKRIHSHLFNPDYRKSHSGRGVRYDVCMKLDELDGIDIEAAPYSGSRWRVLVHKMPRSSLIMRTQAELAFDDVFKRPVASREAIGRKA